MENLRKSIAENPTDLILLFVTAALYLLNNILLGTTGKRLCSIRHILLFCLCAGFVWEFLAPTLKEGSVTDPCDMIAYLFGGSAYWIMLLIGSSVRRAR